MKNLLLFLLCTILLISGCATKSKFVHDRPLEQPDKGKGSIVAALTPINDQRFDGKLIDDYYDGSLLADTQSMLERELLGTGLFEKVFTVTAADKGVKADVTVEPTLTGLEWKVPGYDALRVKAFLAGFLTGLVGGTIYGCTDTDVYGDSSMHLRVTEQATGKVLLDRDYSGHHEEEIMKFKCDTPTTKVAMAGKSLQKTMAAMKADLRDALGGFGKEVAAGSAIVR
jgi:hypothetical protein